MEVTRRELVALAQQPTFEGPQPWPVAAPLLRRRDERRRQLGSETEESALSPRVVRSEPLVKLPPLLRHRVREQVATVHQYPPNHADMHQRRAAELPNGCRAQQRWRRERRRRGSKILSCVKQPAMKRELLRVVHAPPPLPALAARLSTTTQTQQTQHPLGHRRWCRGGGCRERGCLEHLHDCGLTTPPMLLHKRWELSPSLR
mmetsp:Transcript_35996/g.95040  ORF Transcript_35996/g.95040 Transcript_35996/m.95040 type:complete len:203 (-) Transcript_35996:248-856(-)